jgi:hypothetical protein
VNVDTSLYVVTGILVVVIIVLITQNLAVDIVRENSPTEPAISTGVCMFLSLVLMICSCVLPGISTLLDWYFFYTIVVYMSLHSFIWICMALSRKMYRLYTREKVVNYGWYAYSSNNSDACVYEKLQQCQIGGRHNSDTGGYEKQLLTPIPEKQCQIGGMHNSDTGGYEKQLLTPIPEKQAIPERVAQLHSVNFMVCALLLSVFSTHGTIETVLTSPLLFVFMFRTMFKSYAIENSFTTIGLSETYTQVVFEPLLIALDIVVVGSIHVVGTQALAETNMHANTGFAILLFIAHTLAYEGNRSRRTP